MPDISKLISGAFNPAPEPDTGTAKTVFQVLHGAYGALFLSRFATGVLDKRNRDMGVSAARTMWAHGLRAFDSDTVAQALEKCMELNPKFPPTLPELQAQCRAAAPRRVDAPGPKALPMGDKLRSDYARRAREVIAKHEERRVHKATGYRELPCTLDGLKQAIADAVRCAGGDEVAELNRLDRMFARGAA